MIEDPPAIDVIDTIVATEGLDAVFIGRGDLTVSLGVAGPGTPEVKAATETIAAAALKAGKAVIAMTPGGDKASRGGDAGRGGRGMSADWKFPPAVAEAISHCNPASSRRDFLKSSGALVVSMAAGSVPGAQALAQTAENVLRANDPYPDPDFRELDT